MVVSYPLLQNMVTLGQNQAVRSQVTEWSLYSPHFPGSLPEPSDMIRMQCGSSQSKPIRWTKEAPIYVSSLPLTVKLDNYA